MNTAPTVSLPLDWNESNKALDDICTFSAAIRLRDLASAQKASYSAASRGVAQLGSALRSGRRGRWFKSSRPDQLSPHRSEHLSQHRLPTQSFPPHIQLACAQIASGLSCWGISQSQFFVAFECRSRSVSFPILPAQFESRGISCTYTARRVASLARSQPATREFAPRNT